MLKDYTDQLEELSRKRLALANKYALARKRYGELKSELDIILTGYILQMQEKTKNIGYERALLTLLALKPELTSSYKDMIQQYNNYKAIERLLDAHDSRQTSLQSLMKYNIGQEIQGGQ